MWSSPTSRWVMVSVVRPAMSGASAPSSAAAVAGRAFAVGSSRIRTGAPLSSARAMLSRWRSPPLNCQPCSPIQVS